MSQLLTPKEKLAATDINVFTFLWLGSFISSIGDCLSNFALDIWILQTTESINFYILGILFTTLPTFFLAPITGALVDRWPRRWVMIISEILSALCILAIALLFITDSLKIWHIFFLTSLNSTFSGFEILAFKSTVSLLVSPEDLARANGLNRVGDEIATLVAPILAGVLLTLVQIQGILLINCASFFLGLIPLLIVRIPELKMTSPDFDGDSSSLMSEITQGWTYLSNQTGLLSLIILRAIYSFISATGSILFVPLILNLTATNILGIILFIAGLGGVLGGIIMGTWVSLQERLAPLICGCMLGIGLEAIMSGLEPSLILITITAFLFVLTFTLADGSIQILLQKQVLPELQGRVFSLSNAVMSVAGLAGIASASVVDPLLEPLMAFEGPWANGLGQIIGTGPGRGIGLMFIMLGVVAILTAAVAYRHTPLMQFEQETTTIDNPNLSQPTKN
ncbi:MAG: MFS transporter [Symploca sp. SIO2D2]|nr:MFS transporter [Symploca sp. SIO2D2]